FSHFEMFLYLLPTFEVVRSIRTSSQQYRIVFSVGKEFKQAVPSYSDRCLKCGFQ
ncbi:hypothetical protein GOODEAATRI_008551, partial [Goodea atripinnis]